MNYEIKNKFLKAKIKSFGAELNSLKKVDNDNLEYIWQGDNKYWARHSPILFPIVGRLKEDSYLYKNQKYTMTQHGFARDCEFEVMDKKEDFIEFKIKNDEKSLEIYPFLFELYLSYKLEKNLLIISYKVVNKSDGAMFFSIGAHPAFNWTLKDNENKEDYFLEFENIKNTKRYFLNDFGLIYKNEDLEIIDNKIPLNEKLFQNDALVFSDLNIQNITFKNSKNSHFIKLNFEKFPYLGVWSKPTGCPFLCIEPWFGVADDIESNQNFEEKRGILELKNGEIFEASYSIEIG